MNKKDFLEKAEALSDFVIPFANSGSFDEHSLSTSERGVLELVYQARNSNIHEKIILEELSQILQKFIVTSEVKRIPLTTETENLINQAKEFGISFQETRQRPSSRPLSEEPIEPEKYNIFVDESGTGSFKEEAQPVLCLAGVIARDSLVPVLTKKSEELLIKYDLPKDIEFHSYEFIKRDPGEPLNKLSIEERCNLLKDFLVLGMEHIEGVHHISMLKSLVKPWYRRKMEEQGLNPYSHSVVWFVVTLDRACIYVKFGVPYQYYYDRTDAYRKDIRRIFRALESTTNQRLHLFNLKKAPIPIESHKSRFIQLADVISFYLNRYRQFEVKTFSHREELDKHKDKIFGMYEIIKPKILNYINRDLQITVDWQALADFSLP